MKAVCLTADNTVRVEDVPMPSKAEAGHVIVKMIACGINLGDSAFIGGLFPVGTIPVSQYDICGVSGVGVIEQVGSGLPKEYVGRNVTIYRSLKFSDSLVGTWCEKAHVARQHFVILPNDVDPVDYSASLVNVITPYAFLKQIIEEGHKGIITTAGSSATGLAMLGICAAYDFPLISIVRSEKAKDELQLSGAKNVLAQTDPDFKRQLAELSQGMNATGVFDGVGASLVNDILEVLPRRTTVYSYGYLGGVTPFTIPPGLMMRKGLTIKSFGNFTSKTVQDTRLLDEALTEIGRIIRSPRFRTKPGRKFSFEEAGDALQYVSSNGGKAVLYPV